jgi:hypothetical protein
LDALEVTLDLGPLALDDITTESFDDLIARRGDESGNLFPLRKCRLVLQDGGRLQLANPYPGAREPAYLDLQEMLLRAAGFTDIVVKDAAGPVLVEAVKRAPVVEEQEYGMVVRELVTPEDVAASHVFSRDYYYYKDFNYDLEVARQFDLHADSFAIYDRHQQMIALARIAWRVPGYRCPFMYSVTESGDHYRVPRRCRRTGEVSAIYREGRDGVFAYKRLMEFLVYHVPPISLPDSVWTTYEVNDPYTGNLYKSKFLMEDMGVRLTYRDFGGKWILLCTDRIEELHRLHHSLFRG